MVEQISFHYKWNEAWLLVINELPPKLPNDLRLRLKKISKLQKIVAQRSVLPQSKGFDSTSKNLLKNRNWTFPVVHYFTWKLDFVLNKCE